MHPSIQRITGTVAALGLVLSVSTAAIAAPASGPGAVSVGVDVTVWDSSLSGPGLVPIGGAGQINGEFTTAERLGIQVGLRAQERFQGPLDASPSANGKVGIYQAAAGTSDSEGRATWNYDWHVDLRGAKGVAKGTTLEDYTIELDTDMFAAQFGFPVPLDLTFGGALPADAVLYQGSLNPVFGASGFDPLAAGTYHLSLILTPTTFNGPSLTATITVEVS